MTEHVLSTWVLTYAAHGALFTALAAVAERTRWGAAPSRRDAFWKFALVGAFLTSTIFVAAGSAPSGAAVRLSPHAVIAPAVQTAGVFWLAVGWIAVSAALALRAARAWYLGVRSAGRRRVIRDGPTRAILAAILGSAADRVTLTCSRTLDVPVAFAREICVPIRAFRELPHDELRALLAHEAAHVVRRDAGWLMIAAAVRTLAWWQPLTLFAAARLRLAMELCCDEQAAGGPSERAALARCLVTVAGWNVQDHGPALAAMASRGSALRRRLESLLDDGPRRDRRVRPWLSIAAVALPAVWLAPVVTMAGLARVPATAARLVHPAHASVAPAPLDRPGRQRAAPEPAARSSKRVAAAAATPPVGPEHAAIPEIAHDEPHAVAPESASSGPTLEPAAGAPPESTSLRDAIAAVRITPEPVPSRTRFDVSDLERRSLPWIMLLRNTPSFDPRRPRY